MTACHSAENFVFRRENDVCAYSLLYRLHANVIDSCIGIIVGRPVIWERHLIQKIPHYFDETTSSRPDLSQSVTPVTPSLAKLSRVCVQPCTTCTPFVLQGCDNTLCSLTMKRPDRPLVDRLTSLLSSREANYWMPSRTTMTSNGRQIHSKSLQWLHSLVRQSFRHSWGAFAKNTLAYSPHRSGPCPHRSTQWLSKSIERSGRCCATASHLETILLKSKQPSARRSINCWSSASSRNRRPVSGAKLTPYLKATVNGDWPSICPAQCCDKGPWGLAYSKHTRNINSKLHS